MPASCIFFKAHLPLGSLYLCPVMGIVSSTPCRLQSLGDLSLSTELHVRLGMEMATNKIVYLKKHKDSGFALVSPSYSEALKDCLKDGSYLSAYSQRVDGQSLYNPQQNFPPKYCKETQGFNFYNVDQHVQTKTVNNLDTEPLFILVGWRSRDDRCI